MKRILTIAVLTALSASQCAFAKDGGGRTTDADHRSSSSASDADASGAIRGTGVVRGVDPAGGKVTLRHGPIAAIGWPAMTMTFTVSDVKALSKLSPGQNVDFDLAKRGDDYVITSIR
jgi:Cu(I)/Ag(I) efflux system protein CusF